MDSFPLQEQGPVSDRTHGNSQEQVCYSSRYSSTPLETTCKKHPGKPSCYFISQEPWVQFCQKCALNMALCGKKIERRLTEDERRRKLELEGIVFELRSKSKIAEQKEVDIKAKLTIVETEYLIEVENLLRFYDSQIQEWTRKRNEVYKSYSEEILDYFKVLEQVRYKFSLSAMQFKNSLQNIENNFVTMIHDLPLTDFNEQLAHYRKCIDKVIDNQDKVFDFGKKRDSFGKLVKQLVDKTDAFKNSKRFFHSTGNNNVLSSVPQSTKVHMLDCGESRKQQRSLTPNKKINIPILHDQNYFSKDEDLKLKLKPTAGYAATSSSRSKLMSDRKRTNSKMGPKKDEIDLINTSRLHRA